MTTGLKEEKKVRVAKELWDLLDDIETASARFKGNPQGYRLYIERKSQERHKFFSMQDDGSLILGKV